MNMSFNSTNYPLRVAVIGSGPAGFYTVGQLFKEYNNIVEVDMFDKLPTPFGLVRYGVAPDHQKIKSVTKLYERIADNPKFRFWGNVEIGKHIQIDDLRRIYHCVVFAYGTNRSRSLGILGEDFDGSYAATDFVAWYNGHPDYQNHQFDLSVNTAVIVGVGNVAIDVARILCLTEEELIQSDVTDNALHALLESNIREVVLLGRRGPAQAAFTNPELKELINLQGADLKIDLDEAKLDRLSEEYVVLQDDKLLRSKVDMIKDISYVTSFNNNKSITIRFLVSPLEIFGGENNKVVGMRLVKNELYKTNTGYLKSKATDKCEDISAGIVLTSVGYMGSAINGIPFDEKSGTIPNINGRVFNQDTQEILTGMYTCGWIKRGPTGVIGTNKEDAIETVHCMIEDVQSGKYIDVDPIDKDCVDEIITDAQPDTFTFDDWKRIDKIEIERGKVVNRPRIKFTSTLSMLKVLNRA
tara:strand:- start:77 stop:1483 length:1407 start_codon:yes stop_codon:yes gene_type:complete